MSTIGQEGRALRSTEEVLKSYDAQAEESYRVKLENPFFEAYGRSVGHVLAQYAPKGLLEVGCGDGVTLRCVAVTLPYVPVLGVDISNERLKIARRHTAPYRDIGLQESDMFSLPFEDSSFDVVFTSHAMEPNGGREKEALRELFRVAKRYLILFEPDYDIAPKIGKRRMDRLGYVKHIRQHIKDLRMPLETCRPFRPPGNPLNPTSLFVIWKGK